MRRTGIRNAWLLMLCLLTVSAAAAQNLQKKVKNAKGIEVIYQSSYKGKIRPGQIKMTVSGDQVALESVSPKGEKETATEGIREDKQPVIKNYIDYAGREAYKWAELPDGKIISAFQRNTASQCRRARRTGAEGGAQRRYDTGSLRHYPSQESAGTVAGLMGRKDGCRRLPVYHQP